MLLPDAARYIRSAVPVTSVLALYGYTPNRSGFLCCPFHPDPSPSLKVYDTPDSHSWYCFGCHAGGSSIDFVMRHESCSFAAAVRAIDWHLRLHLLEPEDIVTQEHDRAEQLSLDRAEFLLLSCADALQLMLESRYRKTFDFWRAIDMLPVPVRTADLWTRYYSALSDLDYLEYRLEKIDSFRKEVRLWRNGQRLPDRRRKDHPSRLRGLAPAFRPRT